VVIAGGTDLLGALKDNIHPTYPELLVDIKRVAGLRHVTEDQRGLRIGALTTLHELASHPVVRQKYRMLADAARSVASPQVRHMGTVGGNLCQEPRCWYYRYPENQFHCLRKGGQRCNAMLGENRYHSIFGAVRVAPPACAHSCPAHVEIPSYLSRVRRGDLRAAAAIVLGCNPMPAITGRVCPHTCEQHCNRCDFDEAVSVRAIERHLGDYVLEHAGELYTAPKKQSGRHVAVVGAGPAGLAAAFHLRRLGHRVTVFDAMPEAGGMLTYGIPAYRLPKDVVRRQVAAFARMGIVFRLGEAVGEKGTTLAALRKSFDGVFLGTGAWRQKKLGLEHEELLTPGFDFLLGIQRGTVKSPGRHVLVIGGGNVAVDVAISALRLGAKDVTMACLERRDEMPAFPEDIDQALLERVKIMPSWGPHRVLLEGSALAGLELVRCTAVFDAQGRFAPTFDPATKATVHADQVLTAIGLGVDLSYAGQYLKVERNVAVVDKETGATSVRGVFAGGDMTIGPASVVEALAAGRRAAEAIHAGLANGKAATQATVVVSRPTEALEFDAGALGRSKRVTESEVPVGQRKIDREDRATLAAEAVEAEARRCANCGCVAVNASDIAPALIALGAAIKTTRRTVAAEDFFAVEPRRSTVLEPGELVEEIVVPAPPAGARQGFSKFRTRASIDFPIASVAAMLTMKGDTVAGARIVLGAVAAVPLRAASAEAYLRGKRPDAATAAQAAALAVEGVTPLARNRFKVQIAKALVGKVLAGG
jgi:NADPH-dependent glutamate synthase beta subunit-like oxidoreductase